MTESPFRVAVVGDGEAVSRVRQAVEEAGSRLVDRGAADALVAVGDGAIRDTLIAESTSSTRSSHRPIIPLRNEAATDGSRIVSTVRDLIDGTERRVQYPVLSVETDEGIAGRAVFDVAFVTDEPARISEYAVETDAGRGESFRADGVAVATPLGSDGYANAAGGPVIGPGAGLAVVPIAPFTTRRDTWVVADGVTLSVERESEAVSLIVDGARREVVVPGRSVRVAVADRVAVVPEPSRSGQARATDRKGSNNS